MASALWCTAWAAGGMGVRLLWCRRWREGSGGGGPHLLDHDAFGEAVVEQVAAELDVRGRRRPHAGVRVVVHLRMWEERGVRSGGSRDAHTPACALLCTCSGGMEQRGCESCGAVELCVRGARYVRDASERSPGTRRGPSCTCSGRTPCGSRRAAPRSTRATARSASRRRRPRAAPPTAPRPRGCRRRRRAPSRRRRRGAAARRCTGASSSSRRRAARREGRAA